jgi:hypothetical protein
MSAYSIMPHSLWDKYSLESIWKEFIDISQDSISDEFVLSDNSKYFQFSDFEESEKALTHQGHGSYSGLKKERNSFLNIPPNTLRKNKEYIASMWMHNGEKDALNLYLRVIVEEYDAIADEWFSTTSFPDQAETIDGDWSLVEFTFKVRDSSNEISIISKGKKDAKASLHLDDLLVKEKGLDVYRLNKDNGTLLYNNHIIDISTLLE